MDTHASRAISALLFLDTLFPNDDDKHKHMKPVFAEAIEHCKTLKAEARAEEELALKDSVEKTIKIEEAVTIAPTLKIEETKEEPATELSEPKKAQLLKEAVLARDQLRAVMDEVEAHLKVLQPSDKVEIVGGEVVVQKAPTTGPDILKATIE